MARKSSGMYLGKYKLVDPIKEDDLPAATLAMRKKFIAALQKEMDTIKETGELKKNGMVIRKLRKFYIRPRYGSVALILDPRKPDRVIEAGPDFTSVEHWVAELQKDASEGKFDAVLLAARSKVGKKPKGNNRERSRVKSTS